MDFWGPLPNGEHIPVAIEEYSHSPEVEFVSSTGALAVIPYLDKISSIHGFPEKIKIDGSPLFNSNDNHEYSIYMKWAGIKTPVVTPDNQWLGRKFYESNQKDLAHYQNWSPGSTQNKKSLSTYANTEPHHTHPDVDHQQKCSLAGSTMLDCWKNRRQHLIPASAT